MSSLFETEIKLKISEQEAKKLIEILKRQTADLSENSTQTDIYYDTEKAELQNKDFVVRARLSNNKGYVALKSPRIFVSDTIQKRIELEFEVRDYQSVQRQIKNQGLLETAIMDKRRTEFGLSDVSVAIDEVPFIGWFLEIEANSVESIEKIIKDFKLESYERIKLNYGELLDIKMSELGLPQRPHLNASFDQYELWKSKQKMSKFYITTTLPYINAEPHIGFAREIVQADVLARYHRELGDEVFFNTGTDEHGLKVYRKVKEFNLEPQAYCDQEVKKWQGLKELLNLSFDNFIRTTDPGHIKTAQEFWRICDQAGFIYKKQYTVKYCVGCELEKTLSELVNGCCPLHPNQELETIDEENYFFKFSEFQKKLGELYEKNPDFVSPQKRFNEIKKFVEGGLEDFSISRLKEKMPWGIEVPGDPEHTMYVWFDALVNYISAIGWFNNLEKFNAWWPAVQICGKDNLRQQTAMWQAMLMAAGLPNSRQIFIGGFIVSGGQKMSKSLGNVIAPMDMVAKFGIDGTRYLLLSAGNFGEDADVTMERLAEKYNADLANGLGNLVSRTLKLNEKLKIKSQKLKVKIKIQKLGQQIEKMQLKETLDEIWQQVDWANKKIEETKLWELVKNDEVKAKEILGELLAVIAEIGEALAPFVPATADKIKTILETNQAEVLFPRV